MAQYEVFIPAKPGTDGRSVTVEVEASSWLLALRSGMNQIGEQGESLASVMCENRSDGTIVVKDPSSRRMFRIKELVIEQTVEESAAIEKQRADDEAQASVLREQAEKAAKEEVEAKKQLEKMVAEQKKAEEAALKEKMEAEKQQKLQEAEKKQREITAKAAAQASMQKASAERAVRDSERKSIEAKRKAAESATGSARKVKVTKAAMKPEEVIAKIGVMEEVTETFDVDTVLADLFMETMDIMDMDQDESVNFILDLALNTIKAEAGSIILSDVNSILSDLYFAAARGQVADALTHIRIPRGKGIVGFTVSAGCTLAVSDVNQNPNFYKGVAEKTGFESKSILCVPIQGGERTYGAVELVNKVGSNKWTPGEMSVVQFLAQKLGEHLNVFHDNVSLNGLK